MTVFVETDYEHAVQLEAAFNTSPGALVAGDFYRCQSGFLFKRVQARYDRDKDKDNSASVLTTQRGRESSTWEVTGDLIPSGVTGTPTAPDMENFLEAHFGEKFTCTAHTTTAAGSTGVTLNLAVGGGAASGIRTTGGDLIAIDVDATFGVEVRRVVSRAADVVTLNAALSANPVAARNVYTGTTFSFKKSPIKSLHLWQFLSGNNFREKAGGCVPRVMKAAIDFGQETPVATLSFSGTGAEIAPHATAKPTATVAGLPLLPSESKWFWGAVKDCFINSISFESDNGVELRNNTLCSNKPTDTKRTGNNGRYMPKLTVNLLRDTTTHEGYFDNADNLQTYDVIAQMGVAVGNIVAIAAPDFVPDADGSNTDGEVSITLSGRCYAVAGDDEIRFAFI